MTKVYILTDNTDGAATWKEVAFTDIIDTIVSFENEVIFLDDEMVTL